MHDPIVESGASSRAPVRARASVAPDIRLVEAFESALLEAAFSRAPAADLLEQLRAAALRLGCDRFDAAVLRQRAATSMEASITVDAATNMHYAEHAGSPDFTAAVATALHGDTARLREQLGTRDALALRGDGAADHAQWVVAGFDAPTAGAGPIDVSAWLVRMLRHLALCLRIEAEAQRERAARAEEASTQHDLDAFTRAIAHDLRAPVRRIQGFARLLGEDYAPVLGETGNGYVGRIGALCETMQSMCEGLLNAARSSAGEMRRERLDLGVLAKRICADLLATEPGRDGRLVVRGDMLVRADAGMMRVLMENLVGNAWKFTRTRAFAQIEVGARCEHGSTVFFVRDNGVGFDMQMSHRLFQPFSRLHSEAQYPGTGVGLATVHRIVARHGGRIWAESVPEVGTCFHFTLAPDGHASASTARSEF